MRNLLRAPTAHLCVAAKKKARTARYRASRRQTRIEIPLLADLIEHLTAEPPPETRVILYRIAIQAPANVQEHSGAHLLRCAWRMPIRGGGGRSSELRSREAGGSWNRTQGPVPASRSGFRPLPT